MSITFHTFCPIRHRDAVCVEPVAHAEDREFYNCCDCTEAAEAACVVCSAAVNMSNANAALVIERLGLEFDYCGTIDAVELLGRAMVGNVGRDDSGVAPSEDRRPGVATMIDCGLSAGYFDHRLSGLAQLATVARDLGQDITWS